MHRLNFNKGWSFGFLENGDFINDWELKVDWQTVDLPHDFSIMQARRADCRSYRDGGYFPGGFGIYRKMITVDEAELNRIWYIEFEGVYHRAQVRLNGNVLGMHPHGYTSFYYPLNEYLEAGVNELLVYVDNTCLPNSRWYSGSGIYRNVWLCSADPLHIRPWGIFAAAVKHDSCIGLRVDTAWEGAPGGERLRHTLYNADGEPVAGQTEVMHGSSLRMTIPVEDPVLWDTDNPYLYTMRSDILRDGQVIDSRETPVGLRFIEVDAAHGFRLNGKSIKLRGGCVHHDNGILGAASYARSEQRKVELMKASGFNAIRCAHNPPAPAFLEACDRLGMLVIDEAFDVWTRAKKRYDYHAYFADWWRRDLEGMIRRDGNHPSVVIWSIGNEIPEQALKSGFQTAHRLAEHVRSLDDTRPVTQAVDNAAPVNDTLFAQLDICGYNYGYQCYETDIARLPDRVIMGTESVAKHAWENWSLVEKHTNVIGDFLWTSLDYLGEAALGRNYYKEDAVTMANMSPYPWNKANCGDIDLIGHKRPQSYYRDIMWGVRDEPYIAVRVPAPEGFKTEQVGYWGWHNNLPSWSWPGCEGRVMLVDVYAPGEQVELFLNGRSLGKKTLHRPPLQAELEGQRSEDAEVRSRFAAVFEVEYQPGELTAVAENGRRFTLRTAGAERRLRLTADRQVIGADADLVYIDVDLVDENGVLHTEAGDMVELSVEGCGELLAVGSANPKDEELYVGSRHSVWRGQMLAVIRSKGEGEIVLTAEAEGMPAERIIVQTK